MSRDRRLTALAVALVIAVLGACARDDAPPADGRTAKLASIEAEHLCNVADTNFATEDAIRADLVALLDAGGFEYDEWKRWHDSLVDSPERAEQLADATAEGCG